MHYQCLTAAVAVLALAASASADVRIVAQESGKMMGIAANGETVTYIKGRKMRMDKTSGGRQMTTIFDIDSGDVIAIDHKKKEAEIYNVNDLREQLGSAGVEADAINVEVTPRTDTRQVAGYSASGYDVRVSLSTVMGGPQGMRMTTTISGPAYLSADAPGAKDYSAFFTAALDRGFFYGDPRAAKANAGNAKGMLAAQKSMADKGIPLQSTQTLQMSGDGPMAGLLSRMGGGEVTSTVTSISADPLSDDLFVVPAGYKQKRQKLN